MGTIYLLIACGGLSAVPSDHLVGDADGVVVAARDHLEEVLQTSGTQMKQEEIWYQQIMAGETPFDY